MIDRNDRLEEARARALVITRNLRRRYDEHSRELIDGYDRPLDYETRLEDLAIDPEAWEHITQTGIDPRMVFAHPDILKADLRTSLHYRGIAMLSHKRMQQMVGSVQRWEEGTLVRPPNDERILCVARIYNAVISVIITGVDGWSLGNGYRNVLVTIGLTEDGAVRNLVGQEGEAAVKDRISEWLVAHPEIPSQSDGTTTLLGVGANYRMVYSSEPDIKFERQDATGDGWEILATVEIKSGTDPAGALERLGAIQKSFAQTPARSRNFGVLGIVTPEMRARLDELNVARDFSLYDILNDQASWDDFMAEIFHHTLRLL